jgi:hypothetical protein
MRAKHIITNRVVTAFLITIAALFAIASTASARFLSSDNWDPWLAGVDINRYAYSGNDPINLSDPTGHVNENTSAEALRSFIRNVGSPPAFKGEMMVPSEQVRFTQDSVKSTFQNGGSVSTLSELLKADPKSAERLPAIKVVSTPFGHFALTGNRRLAAAKMA